MDLCEKVVSELTEKSLSVLRENPEYQAALEKQAGALDKLLASLPDDTRKAVSAFVDKQNEISLCQLRHTYQSGALDCVKLLKKLGVI